MATRTAKSKRKDNKRSGTYVRLDETQHIALEHYIDGLNKNRVEAGLKKMALSTWLRELGLKHSGNEDLGAAAQALKEAQAGQLL